MTFATSYGPWALVAGASEGVGAAFAAELAHRGLNVVLVARRQAALDDVAAGIIARTGRETLTCAVDLASSDAADTVAAATKNVDIGFLVYCAGADPNFGPFLAQPIGTAETMVQPPDTATVDEVVREAFDNLTNGPTCFVGEQMRAAAGILGSLTRNEAVRLMPRSRA